MHNVICCWCERDAEGFENHVPLHFAGQRNQRLGYRNDIDLLFLDGHELLGEEYKLKLKAAGYRLHDVSGIYRRIERQYMALERFGNYEKKCFLRWPVIAQYFPEEAIVHYDGDLVFNESPDVICGLIRDKTFVLQGCPALTSIADQAWFSQYQQELSRFSNDIEGYSQNAWRERDGWEISEREKWAGQRFREIISSDQDLLSHLIHTDRIVQNRAVEILRDLNAYIVFENPLYLHGYENNLHHARYERREGTDYIDGRRVLFWHMQSAFVHYLAKFVFRRKHLKRSLKRLSNDLERKGLEYYLHKFFVRHLNGKTNVRLNVYQYFFEENDFSEVLNDRTWWKEGVFVSK